MAPKSKSKSKRSGRMLPVLHPDAAGIYRVADLLVTAEPATGDLETMSKYRGLRARVFSLRLWQRGVRGWGGGGG